MKNYSLFALFSIFLYSIPVLAIDAFQIELVRQSPSGTERALLHMNKKSTTMGLTSNMMNLGQNTKIGTFEKKDKKTFVAFQSLYKTFNLDEKSDIRRSISPHAIEIWVNSKQVPPLTTAYNKIQIFAEQFVNKKGWRPIDAKLISFTKDGKMKIENYERRKKKSVDVFLSAEVCDMKMSKYTCKTKLGIVYAPKWARRLPGTIN